MLPLGKCKPTPRACRTLRYRPRYFIVPELWKQVVGNGAFGWQVDEDGMKQTL